MGNRSSNINDNNIRTSISLRSLSSILGKKLHKKGNFSDSSITQSYTEYNQNVFGPQLPSIFLPEFQFRSDISKSDFTLIKKLGEGTFSNVYCCSWLKESNVLIALKVQSKEIIASKHAEKQIKRETNVHKLLNDCEFITKYYDCWQTTTHLFTVMEYVDGGMDLYDLWNERKKIPEDVIRIYAAEIGLALDYLRQHNVVYRDFKMENIALNHRKHIKLIDFGFARTLNDNEKAQTICGTLQYMAPEVASSIPYSFSVDWWCFGVLLYVLSEGNYPYSDNNNVDSHEKLKYEADVNISNASEELSSLIKRLLKINPEERLSSLKELQKQPFFPDSFDFAQISSMNIYDFEEYEKPNEEVTKKTSSIFSGWI